MIIFLWFYYDRYQIFNRLLHSQYLSTLENKYYLANIISVHNALHISRCSLHRGINFHSIVGNEISWTYATPSDKMEKPLFSTGIVHNGLHWESHTTESSRLSAKRKKRIDRDAREQRDELDLRYSTDV